MARPRLFKFDGLSIGDLEQRNYRTARELMKGTTVALKVAVDLGLGTVEDGASRVKAMMAFQERFPLTARKKTVLAAICSIPSWNWAEAVELVEKEKMPTQQAVELMRAISVEANPTRSYKRRRAKDRPVQLPASAQ